MGFFSGLRRKIKKIIPKEVRPFVPYAAAMIPGIGGLAGGYGKFANAALARMATDDEADLKDVLRAGTFAAAPNIIDAGIGGLDKKNALRMFLEKPGMKDGEATKSIRGMLEGYKDPSGFKDVATVIGTAGTVDAGIKAAELNEDALAKYNAEMAAQGIGDRKARRAAIREIYSNTGTWDMDEVDGMLDTYGYRTGGRVGYAMGDFVDTDQIMEDVQDYTVPGIVGKAAQGIGNLVSNNQDKVDMIIDKIISLTPGGSAVEIIKVLVERYGVDPEVAQRKIINRMSDANEGFGPQGLDGTPDDGYRRNIGIDSGAEDYYGETPAMPENLGDMGGNMDDMSGNDLMNRIRRQGMPEGRPIPMPELIPFDPNNPRMRPIPMPGPMGDEDERTMEERFPGQRYDMMNGGRIGYADGDFVGEDQDAIDKDVDGILKRKKKKTTSMEDLIKDTILDKDNDLEENIEMALDGYNRLYPEVKPASIRPLSFEDGGSVDDRLMERVKELQDEGLDFASALAQAMKEDMAANKAQGGLMSMGGNEMDLRGGGFVPMGKAERADDVPARLSKNEFVMTADAVRAAGGGSVQKGADLMYDQMKQLEGQA